MQLAVGRCVILCVCVCVSRFAGSVATSRGRLTSRLERALPHVPSSLWLIVELCGLMGNGAIPGENLEAPCHGNCPSAMHVGFASACVVRARACVSGRTLRCSTSPTSNISALNAVVVTMVVAIGLVVVVFCCVAAVAKPCLVLLQSLQLLGVVVASCVTTVIAWPICSLDRPPAEPRLGLGARISMHRPRTRPAPAAMGAVACRARLRGALSAQRRRSALAVVHVLVRVMSAA